MQHAQRDVWPDPCSMPSEMFGPTHAARPTSCFIRRVQSTRVTDRSAVIHKCTNAHDTMHDSVNACVPAWQPASGKVTTGRAHVQCTNTYVTTCLTTTTPSPIPTQGDTALHDACRFGHVNVVQTLLDARAARLCLLCVILSMSGLHVVGGHVREITAATQLKQ